MLKSFAFTLCAAALTVAQAAAAEITFVDQIVIPSGLKLAGTDFGGISGLAYDAGRNVYYAISDDRSQKGPARFYTLKIEIGEAGIATVDIASTQTLQGPDGQPFPAKGIDPEAIRYAPQSDSLFWSSEGDVAGKPTVFEAKLDGTFIRALEVPEHFNPTADGKSGVRNNLAFEALALTADGRTLYAVTENALAQDGDKATLDAGSRSRIVAFDVASGKPTAEYAYDTDPIVAKATTEPAYNDNGVSEALALDDGRLLLVERSFGSGVGNDIRLYAVDLTTATDVAALSALAGQAVVPATKVPFLHLAEGDHGLDVDNIEAMTFGPEVAGKRTLVLASDDNFNRAGGQLSQILLFDLVGQP